MKLLVGNFARILSPFVMILWLEGCGGISPYSLPPNGQVPKGMSVVFGDVSVGSKVLGWLAIGSFNVINTETSTPVLVQHIEGLGEPFYWCLPPGKYAILDLIVSLGSRTTHFRIYAEFSVHSEHEIIYVGTLDLASLPPSITDDFDSAVRTFHAKYPTLRTVPVKQLLQLEKRK